LAWNESLEQLSAWLLALPKPVGIIAVTDARRRHLLQACLMAGLAVPEQVAIIGIDNDPLTRTLTRTPLSSVIQGGDENGRTAAPFVAQDAAWRPFFPACGFWCRRWASTCWPRASMNRPPAPM